MNRRFSARRQLRFWVVMLLLTAAAGLTYKVGYLGLSLDPHAAARTWQVEAEVAFDALGEQVEVSLAVPGDTKAYRVTNERVASGGYGFRFQEDDGDRRAVWTTRTATGPQTLFYRVRLFDTVGTQEPRSAPPPSLVEFAPFSGPKQLAAETLVEEAYQRSSSPVSFCARLVDLLRAEPQSPDAALLLDEDGSDLGIVNLLRRLAATKGIAVRVARGIYLEAEQRRRPLVEMIEVYGDDGWQVVDPRTGAAGQPKNFVLWQRGGRSLIDVVGGENSEIRFSVLEVMTPTSEVAGVRDTALGELPLGLSLADLPVADQTVFKALAVIPIGALIICLARNIVGMPTTGTFMPMLIALAFRETTLVAGLALFITIVTLGLVIRGYLSGLNLLLVPRISAVVVIVIGLMTVLAWFSHRLGYSTGLNITFFPFVVLAWTIERVTAIWEETGSRDALTQCGGSLLVAAIVHLVWQFPYVEFAVVNFPEFNVIILALILLVGSYTGFRLSELRRFEPLVSDKRLSSSDIGGR